jgi:Predicted integral membrane protein (DUF2269)
VLHSSVALQKVENDASRRGTRLLSSLILFLHIATMFAVVALHSGPQVLLYAATRSRRPTVVAAIADVYARTGRAVPPLGILGGLFGLAAGLVLGLDLLAPWLLIAYGLFALIVLFGGIVSVPHITRLGAAARAADAAYDDLAGRRFTAIVLVDALIYALIVADMVLKPFGS